MVDVLLSLANNFKAMASKAIESKAMESILSTTTIIPKGMSISLFPMKSDLSMMTIFTLPPAMNSASDPMVLNLTSSTYLVTAGRLVQVTLPIERLNLVAHLSAILFMEKILA